MGERLPLYKFGRSPRSIFLNSPIELTAKDFPQYEHETINAPVIETVIVNGTEENEERGEKDYHDDNIFKVNNSFTKSLFPISRISSQGSHSKQSVRSRTGFPLQNEVILENIDEPLSIVAVPNSLKKVLSISRPPNLQGIDRGLRCSTSSVKERIHFTSESRKQKRHISRKALKTNKRKEVVNNLYSNMKYFDSLTLPVESNQKPSKENRITNGMDFEKEKFTKTVQYSSSILQDESIAQNTEVSTPEICLDEIIGNNKHLNMSFSFLEQTKTPSLNTTNESKKIHGNDNQTYTNSEESFYYDKYVVRHRTNNLGDTNETKVVDQITKTHGILSTENKVTKTFAENSDRETDQLFTGESKNKNEKISEITKNLTLEEFPYIHYLKVKSDIPVEMDSKPSESIQLIDAQEYDFPDNRDYANIYLPDNQGRQQEHDSRLVKRKEPSTAIWKHFSWPKYEKENSKLKLRQDQQQYSFSEQKHNHIYDTNEPTTAIWEGFSWPKYEKKNFNLSSNENEHQDSLFENNDEFTYHPVKYLKTSTVFWKGFNWPKFENSFNSILQHGSEQLKNDIVTSKRPSMAEDFSWPIILDTHTVIPNNDENKKKPHQTDGNSDFLETELLKESDIWEKTESNIIGVNEINITNIENSFSVNTEAFNFMSSPYQIDFGLPENLSSEEYFEIKLKEGKSTWPTTEKIFLEPSKNFYNFSWPMYTGDKNSLSVLNTTVAVNKKTMQPSGKTIQGFIPEKSTTKKISNYGDQTFRASEISESNTKKEERTTKIIEKVFNSDKFDNKSYNIEETEHLLEASSTELAIAEANELLNEIPEISIAPFRNFGKTKEFFKIDSRIISKDKDDIILGSERKHLESLFDWPSHHISDNISEQGESEIKKIHEESSLFPEIFDWSDHGVFDYSKSSEIHLPVPPFTDNEMQRLTTEILNSFEQGIPQYAYTKISAENLFRTFTNSEEELLSTPRGESTVMIRKGFQWPEQDLHTLKHTRTEEQEIITLEPRTWSFEQSTSNTNKEKFFWDKYITNIVFRTTTEYPIKFTHPPKKSTSKGDKVELVEDTINFKKRPEITESIKMKGPLKISSDQSVNVQVKESEDDDDLWNFHILKQEKGVTYHKKIKKPLSETTIFSFKPVGTAADEWSEFNETPNEILVTEPASTKRTKTTFYVLISKPTSFMESIGNRSRLEENMYMKLSPISSTEVTEVTSEWNMVSMEYTNSIETPISTELLTQPPFTFSESHINLDRIEESTLEQTVSDLTSNSMKVVTFEEKKTLTAGTQTYSFSEEYIKQNPPSAPNFNEGTETLSISTNDTKGTEAIQKFLGNKTYFKMSEKSVQLGITYPEILEEMERSNKIDLLLETQSKMLEDNFEEVEAFDNQLKIALTDRNLEEYSSTGVMKQEYIAGGTLAPIEEIVEDKHEVESSELTFKYHHEKPYSIVPTISEEDVVGEFSMNQSLIPNPEIFVMTTNDMRGLQEDQEVLEESASPEPVVEMTHKYFEKLEPFRKKLKDVLTKGNDENFATELINSDFLETKGESSKNIQSIFETEHIIESPELVFSTDFHDEMSSSITGIVVHEFQKGHLSLLTPIDYSMAVEAREINVSFPIHELLSTSMSAEQLSSIDELLTEINYVSPVEFTFHESITPSESQKSIENTTKIHISYSKHRPLKFSHDGQVIHEDLELDENLFHLSAQPGDLTTICEICDETNPHERQHQDKIEINNSNETKQQLGKEDVLHLPDENHETSTICQICDEEESIAHSTTKIIYNTPIAFSHIDDKTIEDHPENEFEQNLLHLPQNEQKEESTLCEICSEMEQEDISIKPQHVLTTQEENTENVEEYDSNMHHLPELNWKLHDTSTICSICEEQKEYEPHDAKSITETEGYEMSENQTPETTESIAFNYSLVGEEINRTVPTKNMNVIVLRPATVSAFNNFSTTNELYSSRKYSTATEENNLIVGQTLLVEEHTEKNIHLGSFEIKETSSQQSNHISLYKISATENNTNIHVPHIDEEIVENQPETELENNLLHLPEKDEEKESTLCEICSEGDQGQISLKPQQVITMKSKGMLNTEEYNRNTHLSIQQLEETSTICLSCGKQTYHETLSTSETKDQNVIKLKYGKKESIPINYRSGGKEINRPVPTKNANVFLFKEQPTTVPVSNNVSTRNLFYSFLKHKTVTEENINFVGKIVPVEENTEENIHMEPNGIEDTSSQHTNVLVIPYTDRNLKKKVNENAEIEAKNETDGEFQVVTDQNDKQITTTIEQISKHSEGHVSSSSQYNAATESESTMGSITEKSMFSSKTVAPTMKVESFLVGSTNRFTEVLETAMHSFTKHKLSNADTDRSNFYLGLTEGVNQSEESAIEFTLPSAENISATISSPTPSEEITETILRHTEKESPMQKDNKFVKIQFTSKISDETKYSVTSIPSFMRESTREIKTTEMEQLQSILVDNMVRNESNDIIQNDMLHLPQKDKQETSTICEICSEDTQVQTSLTSLKLSTKVESKKIKLLEKTVTEHFHENEFVVSVSHKLIENEEEYNHNILNLPENGDKKTSPTSKIDLQEDLKVHKTTIIETEVHNTTGTYSVRGTEINAPQPTKNINIISFKMHPTTHAPDNNVTIAISADFSLQQFSTATQQSILNIESFSIDKATHENIHEKSPEIGKNGSLHINESIVPYIINETNESLDKIVKENEWTETEIITSSTNEEEITNNGELSSEFKTYSTTTTNIATEYEPTIFSVQGDGENTLQIEEGRNFSNESEKFFTSNEINQKLEKLEEIVNGMLTSTLPSIKELITVDDEFRELDTEGVLLQEKLRNLQDDFREMLETTLSSDMILENFREVNRTMSGTDLQTETKFTGSSIKSLLDSEELFRQPISSNLISEVIESKLISFVESTTNTLFVTESDAGKKSESSDLKEITKTTLIREGVSSIEENFITEESEILSISNQQDEMMKESGTKLDTSILVSKGELITIKVESNTGISAEKTKEEKNRKTFTYTNEHSQSGEAQEVTNTSSSLSTNGFTDSGENISYVETTTAYILEHIESETFSPSENILGGIHNISAISAEPETQTRSYEEQKLDEIFLNTLVENGTITATKDNLVEKYEWTGIISSKKSYTAESDETISNSSPRSLATEKVSSIPLFTTLLLSLVASSTQQSEEHIEVGGQYKINPQQQQTPKCLVFYLSGENSNHSVISFNGTKWVPSESAQSVGEVTASVNTNTFQISQEITADTEGTNREEVVSTEITTNTETPPDTTILVSTNLESTEESNFIEGGCTQADFENNNNCFCMLDLTVDHFSEEFHITNSSKSKQIECSNFLKVNTGLIIKNETSVLKRDKRSYLYLRYHSRKKREIVEYNKLDEVLENELLVQNNDMKVYAAVGASVSIPCTYKNEIVEREHFMKYIWTYVEDKLVSRKCTIPIEPPISISDRVRETTDGVLKISDVFISDGGNYSCSITRPFGNTELDHKHFIHELIIIERPIFKIKSKIMYDTDEVCSLKQGDIIHNFLPKLLEDLLCGLHKKVCRIEMERPSCVQMEDKNYLTFQYLVKLDPLSSLIPSLSYSKCNFDCQMKICGSLLSLSIKNVETTSFLNIFSLMKSGNHTFKPREVKFPTDKKTVEDTTLLPKLIIGCPPGFGIQQTTNKLCVACPRDFYSSDNSSSCSPCPAIHYQPNLGSTSCVECKTPFEDKSCAGMVLANKSFLIIYIGSSVAIIFLILLCVFCAQSVGTPAKKKKTQTPKRRRIGRRDIEDPAEKMLLLKDPHIQKVVKGPKVPPPDF